MENSHVSYIPHTLINTVFIKQKTFDTLYHSVMGEIIFLI